jgi:hypothetical protein
MMINNLTCLLFCEFSMFANMVPEIAPIEQVHDQVEVFPVLKRIVHVNNKGILQLRQD